MPLAFSSRRSVYDSHMSAKQAARCPKLLKEKCLHVVFGLSCVVPSCFFVGGGGGWWSQLGPFSCWRSIHSSFCCDTLPLHLPPLPGGHFPSASLRRNFQAPSEFQNKKHRKTVRSEEGKEKRKSRLSFSLPKKEFPSTLGIPKQKAKENGGGEEGRGGGSEEGKEKRKKPTFLQPP